jgi:hypothetical protein
MLLFENCLDENAKNREEQIKCLEGEIGIKSQFSRI